MSEMTEEINNIMKPSRVGERYTSEELMIRLKVFIGGILAMTLFGIVFVVLYSLIFVTQPLNAISPIDQKFFELIIPVATFLTGTLSGIMLASGDKAAQMKALDAATRHTPVSPMPSSGGSNDSSFASFKPVATAPSVNSFAPAAAVSATPGMPSMAKPAPSRPPLDEHFPDLD
jgi:hypothetical protein